MFYEIIRVVVHVYGSDGQMLYTKSGAQNHDCQQLATAAMS